MKLPIAFLVSVVCLISAAQENNKPYIVTVDPKKIVTQEEFDRAMAALDRQQPAQKPKLGIVDQWRYDSCRKDATNSPTERGVIAGLAICKEKFGQ